MEIPRAQPLPVNPVQPSIGGQASEGLQAGAQIGYLNTQNKQLQIQNQYAPFQAQLKQQEIQMQMQKQQAEIQKAKSEQGLGLMKAAGEGYDRWGDDAGPELFNTFKKGVDMVQPGAIPDTWQYTPEMGGIMKQAGKAVDSLQSGDATLDDTMLFLSKLKAKASKFQQERLQGVLTPIQNMYDQEQTQKRTTQTIGAENTRAVATATAPMVGQAYSVNLAKHALSKGNELNDHIAINEFGKLVNNGTPIPLPELKKMVASGTWGPRLAQTFKTWTGEGALSDEQRTMMQAALDTIGEAVQGSAATKASQIPGANPPKLPPISAYKIGQTVNFAQGTYKKVKDGPDTDPSSWQLVPKVKR